MSLALFSIPVLIMLSINSVIVSDNVDLVRSKYPNALRYLYHNIYASAATNYLAIKVCHYEKIYIDKLCKQNHDLRLKRLNHYML